MSAPVHGRLWLWGGENVSRIRLSHSSASAAGSAGSAGSVGSVGCSERLFPLSWPWPTIENYGSVLVSIEGWLHRNLDRTRLQPAGQLEWGLKVCMSEPAVITLCEVERSLRAQAEWFNDEEALASTPSYSLPLDDDDENVEETKTNSQSDVDSLARYRWQPIVALLPKPRRPTKHHQQLLGEPPEEETSVAMGWINLCLDDRTELFDRFGLTVPLAGLQSGTLVTITMEIFGVLETDFYFGNVQTAKRLFRLTEGWEWGAYEDLFSAYRDLQQTCPQELLLRLPKDLWNIILVYACRRPTSTIRLWKKQLQLQQTRQPSHPFSTPTS
jgi:hypothetical protein